MEFRPFIVNEYLLPISILVITQKRTVTKNGVLGCSLGYPDLSTLKMKLNDFPAYCKLFALSGKYFQRLITQR